MRKKIFCVLLFILFFAITPAKSADMKEKLAQIGFHTIEQKDETAEITKFFKKQQRYANRKNEKKIRETFDKEYIDFDGIDLEKTMLSLKTVWSLYDNIDYKTTVDSIKISGNYAVAQTTDTIQGTTKTPYDAHIKGNGTFKAEAKSFNYLKKINGEWKITSAQVISETTSLLYGSAMNIPIKIIAPDCVKANEQYNVILNAEIPEKTAAIASITSELVEYPSKSNAMSQEIFRSVKQEGELERVLTANNKGLNEDAMGCISFAKAIVDNEKGEVRVIIDGVGFISSRVNVIPQRKANNE